MLLFSMIQVTCRPQCSFAEKAVKTLPPFAMQMGWKSFSLCAGSKVWMVLFPTIQVTCRSFAERAVKTLRPAAMQFGYKSFRLCVLEVMAR